VDWDGARFVAAAEDAADVGTVDAPCKTSDTAARSVVKVLAGIWVVEAASRLAGGAEVPGVLPGEGDI